MNNMNSTNEQISAFADGEASDSQIDMALAVLRTPNGRETWTTYHEIGDVLRSDDMAVNMSSDFTSRLMKRLEEEPTVVAPRVVASGRNEQVPEQAAVAVMRPGRKQAAFRGMFAAAAVASLAFVLVPQLMSGTEENSAQEGAVMVAAPVVEPAIVEVANSQAVTPVINQKEEILRDERIDEYLFAHQRSSPSVYNSAQYARSATFAVDSEK